MYDDIMGVYRIYENNELIAEAKNALTETGREILIQYLLRGRSAPFVNSLCVGLSQQANTTSSATNLITDNSLVFQVATTPVERTSFTFTDNVAETLVFEGTLEGDQQFVMYEMGITSLRTTIGAADPELLFDFDTIDNFEKYGTASAAGLSGSAYARLGTQMYSIPQCLNVANDYIETNLQVTDSINTIGIVDTYSSNDVFRIAAYKESASVASVTLQFLVDSSNYYTLTFGASATLGYNVLSARKGAAVATGSPKWSNINTLRVSQNSASPIFFDGIRIEKSPGIIDIDNGLISRAVLSSPVIKTVGTPLDIEYRLVIGFNKGV